MLGNCPDKQTDTPVDLIYKIAPKHGLCNGSRLIVTHLKNCVIEAQILIGNHVGETTVTKKGRSRKPAAMTRSPTDPGSHTLSIHLKSTDT